MSKGGILVSINLIGVGSVFGKRFWLDGNGFVLKVFCGFLTGFCKNWSQSLIRVSKLGGLKIGSCHFVVGIKCGKKCGCGCWLGADVILENGLGLIMESRLENGTNLVDLGVPCLARSSCSVSKWSGVLGRISTMSILVGLLIGIYLVRNR